MSLESGIRHNSEGEYLQIAKDLVDSILTEEDLKNDGDYKLVAKLVSESINEGVDPDTEEGYKEITERTIKLLSEREGIKQNLHDLEFKQTSATDPLDRIQ